MTVGDIGTVYCEQAESHQRPQQRRRVGPGEAPADEAARLRGRHADGGEMQLAAPPQRGVAETAHKRLTVMKSEPQMRILTVCCEKAPKRPRARCPRAQCPSRPRSKHTQQAAGG